MKGGARFWVALMLVTPLMAADLPSRTPTLVSENPMPYLTLGSLVINTDSSKFKDVMYTVGRAIEANSDIDTDDEASYR